MQSTWFAGETLSTHVHNTFSRPGLFLSTKPEFLEGGDFLKQIFPAGAEVAPQKNVWQYSLQNYYIVPVP